jgi:hypothetical protein
MTSVNTSVNFPALCIPRAMVFQTAEFVENAFNLAMHGKFVKKIDQTTTTDKSGTEFNVFFIHPDQDFQQNNCTELLYTTLREQGTASISTGKGKYFWKVRLYVPHAKAQYLPKPEAPVPVGPRILSKEDEADFLLWRKQREEERRAAEAQTEKNRLGNLLYPLVQKVLVDIKEPVEISGKITGMILEMETREIEWIISCPVTLLNHVTEAVAVLKKAGVL